MFIIFYSAIGFATHRKYSPSRQTYRKSVHHPGLAVKESLKLGEATMAQCQASKIIFSSAEGQVLHRCGLPAGHFGVHVCANDKCSHEWMDRGTLRVQVDGESSDWMQERPREVAEYAAVTA